MTTRQSELTPIQIMPGVQPDTDRTAFATKHYTASRGIRFRNGFPEKIGGNRIFSFNNGATVKGVARTLYSAQLETLEMVIGSNEDLYSVQGSVLTNITPLEVTTHAIPDSIDTYYDTLPSDPFTVTSGSKDITVEDPLAARLMPGDIIEYSGAVTVAGIPDTEFNAPHIVRSVIDSTHYMIMVSTPANTNTSGGGASVVRTTGLITINAVANGQADGDRVKITGATDTGGILAVEINLEQIVRNAATDSFDVMTDGLATSSVTGGGGSGVEYQKQIAGGNENESAGAGYGLGLYGVGLYGVSKTSPNAHLFPRIWFIDRFADAMILTPGNQGGVYTWDGDEAEAPVLLSGAPSSVNYAFVSNNIVVTFGYNGVPNKIFASDQGNPTNWTASSLNQVFEDNIEGAGRLLSHVPVNGLNLIFTQNQTYTFRYIGLQLVWEILPLDLSVGIIAPMARCTTKGIAFWIGQNNFYMWRGGNVEIVPANSQAESTIVKYIFNNLNTTQQSKIFAWYNSLFDEVWFHIPSASSNEPDVVARVNLQDYSWCPDVMDRTAAEYPNNHFILPRMMDTTIMRIQESGTDDDTLPLPFSLRSNLRGGGKDNLFLTGFVPDSSQTGNINVNVRAKRFPQSAQLTANKNYTVTPTTEQVSETIMGRNWDYEWSGSQLGQTWEMGAWQEWLQDGAPQ